MSPSLRWLSVRGGEAVTVGTAVHPVLQQQVTLRTTHRLRPSLSPGHPDGGSQPARGRRGLRGGLQERAMKSML